MMIDKISRVNALNSLQNTKRTTASENILSGTDEISVSQEAKELAETYYLDQVAAETPDIRSDLVEQVKIKMQNPNYFDEAIDSTADRILSAFGL